jgi:Flp pilus assembly protein TadG
MRISPTRKRNGNVLVEFALSSSLLMFIFMGTFQFGYSFYQYNTLTNAIRGGVRYASMAKISNSGNGSVPSAYITAIRNTVVYGSPVISDNPKPIIKGLQPSDVDVAVTFDAKYVPTAVTVKVTKFTIDAVVKQFTINGKPSLQMPFLGQYCPVSC